MTAFTDLIDEVSEGCQQAPDPVLERAIRNAAIELCEAAPIYRRTLNPISITANQPLYALTSPEADTSITQVMWAQIEDDAKLIQAGEDQMDLWWDEPQSAPFRFDRWDCDSLRNGPSWRQYTQSRPQAFYVDREDTTYRVRLIGIPTGDIPNSLAVNVALKPARNATTLPDWIFEDYFLTLADGAKGKVLAIPNRPWTGLQLAAALLAKFEEDKEVARQRALRSHIRDDEAVGHVRAWI